MFCFTFLLRNDYLLTCGSIKGTLLHIKVSRQGSVYIYYISTCIVRKKRPKNIYYRFMFQYIDYVKERSDREENDDNRHTAFTIKNYVFNSKTQLRCILSMKTLRSFI